MGSPWFCLNIFFKNSFLEKNDFTSNPLIMHRKSVFKSCFRFHLLVWFLCLPALVLSTTTLCPISCPTNYTSSDITIDKASSDNQILITTDNCPPYDLIDEIICFDSRVVYIPKNPQVLDEPYDIALFSQLRSSIGLLRNGVLLYGPGNNFVRNMMLSELGDLDQCMAMADENGIYRSRGLYAYDNGNIYDYNAEFCDLPLDLDNNHSPSFGWMWDGYEIFGLYNGEYENITLDDCGGHENQLTNSASKYHYHMTLEYPYTINCFHGCPNKLNNPSISFGCEYEAPTSTPTSVSQKSNKTDTNEISDEILVILVLSIFFFCCVCIIGVDLSRPEHKLPYIVQSKPGYISKNQFWSPKPQHSSEEQRMLNGSPNQLKKVTVNPDAKSLEQYSVRSDRHSRITYKNTPSRENQSQRTHSSTIPTYQRYRNRSIPYSADLRKQPNYQRHPRTLQQEFGLPRPLPYNRGQVRVSTRP